MTAQAERLAKHKLSEETFLCNLHHNSYSNQAHFFRNSSPELQLKLAYVQSRHVITKSARNLDGEGESREGEEGDWGRDVRGGDEEGDGGMVGRRRKGMVPLLFQ